MNARAQPRGFTLVELTVALFITSIVFALGYGALNQALGNRKAIEAQSVRLLAVQGTLRKLEQDFELLQPRPVRALIGDGYEGPLIAPLNPSTAVTGDTGSVNLGSAAQPLVRFTRGGWSNPAGLQRSELARIYYYVIGGKLMRGTWPVLDATEAVQPAEVELIDQVQGFSLRFMDAAHNWQNAWPASKLDANNGTMSQRARPIAVEVTLQLRDWGRLVRIIEVAG